MKLEVKTSKVQYVAASVLALGMLPLSFLTLYQGVTRASVPPVLIGIVCLLLLAVVFFLVERARRNSVKSFTDRGLTRGDLSELPWSDLEKVIDKTRLYQGRPTIWRTEIHFRNGRFAWIIPSKVSNYGEVKHFVDGLACEHTNK